MEKKLINKFNTMKTKFVLLIFLAFQVCAKGQALVHELLSGSGQVFTNESIDLSWSLGEISISTYETNELILTQGFQQTGIYTTPTLNPEIFYDINLYPNPARDLMTMTFDQSKNIFKSYNILDMHGKTWDQGIIFSDEQNINIQKLPTGLYILSVIGENGKNLSNNKFYKTK